MQREHRPLSGQVRRSMTMSSAVVATTIAPTSCCQPGVRTIVAEPLEPPYARHRLAVTAETAALASRRYTEVSSTERGDAAALT